MNITKEQREIMKECFIGGNIGLRVAKSSPRHHTCFDLMDMRLMECVGIGSDYLDFRLTEAGCIAIQYPQATEPKVNEPEHSEQDRIIDGLADVANKLFNEKVVAVNSLDCSMENFVSFSESINAAAEKIDLKIENKSLSKEIGDLKEHIFALLLERKGVAVGRTCEVRRWYARSCELKKENAELKSNVNTLKAQVSALVDLNNCKAELQQGLTKENAELKAEIEDLSHKNKRLRGIVRFWKDEWSNWDKEGLPKEKIEKLKANIPVEPVREESQFIKAAEADAELREKVFLDIWSKPLVFGFDLGDDPDRTCVAFLIPVNEDEKE